MKLRADITLLLLTGFAFYAMYVGYIKPTQQPQPQPVEQTEKH